MPIQTLGLNTQALYPPLTEVVDVVGLEARIKDGLIHRCLHPDAKTQLLCYTSKCVKERAWDEITTRVRGWIIRDGQLIARPPGRTWAMNTPGMPETSEDGFPNRIPDISIMECGVQGTMFPGQRGVEFAEKDCFVSGATLWAGNWYRKCHGKATWMAGWTPVFQIVGPKFGEVGSGGYVHEDLLLMTMVNNHTGEEAALEDVRGWGGFNDIPYVGIWNKGLDAALGVSDVRKGLVLSWRFPETPPIKVKVMKKGDDRERILSNTTPELIWELCRDGAELGPLVAAGLPEDFVGWVRGWEMTVRGEKTGAETDALEILAQLSKVLPELPVKDVGVRKGVISQIHEIAKERDQLALMPILIAMIDDVAGVEDFAWAIAKRTVVGQKGWRK